ncbi:UNVERIFIED_CONTAM: hypothetical protein FKN15_078041 [Acipenser sinensis]
MEKTASEKLLTVIEFESHLEKLDNEKRELIQSDIAALHHFYSKHLEYPDNAALVVLFAQVNCNGFTIEDEELSHLGSAVFPDVALMNHSCCPNVIVTYKGTLAEVRAIQEINAGDEVFTSYIDLLYPTDDRNDRLKDSYFFNCDCKECATKGKDKAKMETRKMNEPLKPETIRDMVKYARNVIEEFRRAKHYKNILFFNSIQLRLVNDLLEICELSLDKMGDAFEDTNVYMLHMMYQAMGVCLYMQDWEGALRYGEKIIKPYSVALMNHSCCPNVIVTYKGTLAEVRAIQEINAGDEVFTSYIDLLYPTDDRNDRLKDSYFFNCDCKECATKGKDKAKMETRKMNEPLKPETIRDMVKYARNVIEEFRRAKHYKNILFFNSIQLRLVNDLLEICELSLDKMGDAFEDTNVYMLHMMYQAMGVCLYMQDWEGALRYGEKIIKPYRYKHSQFNLFLIALVCATVFT